MRILVLAVTLLVAPLASAGLLDDVFGGIKDAVTGAGEKLGFGSELTERHSPEMKYQNLTVDQLKAILVSKEEWVGVYHLQQAAVAFNEFDNPISASFVMNDDGTLTYHYIRAQRSNGEIDDGTCNFGAPLPRILKIKMGLSSIAHTIKKEENEGYLYAQECSNGVIGDTKEIWVSKIKVSKDGHLVMEALILPGVGTSYHMDPAPPLE